MGIELTVIFYQILRIAVPYVLTSVGATFSERGGVVNLALEGLMLAGAFAAAVGQYKTGSAFLGILTALFCGLGVSLFFAFMTVTLKADQIVAGIATNIVVMGATRFGLSLVFGSSRTSERISGIEVQSFFLDPLFICAVFSVVAGHLLLYKTPYGLRLRATGESAETADSAGVNVAAMRYSGVLISGALASLGGAFLVYQQHSFTDNMSAGRGFMALAAMIIGKWTPVGAALASLMFAAGESMEIWFQTGAIPSQLVQSMPYVIALIVLAGFVGKATPPKNAGVPFSKERQS
ncbi:MAG: ABC transporter permease [Chlorobiaceae bacterium]|nr:ABC transporter permease [Chlorobiaceae bacterium]NTW10723.1 ABC transporter permease [Chlorobiaceae bacterium]